MCQSSVPSGKYPDGDQVLIRGADTRAAFDTPIVSNHIGPEFDATELVVMGHAHEDHMAGLHRLPHASVYVNEADLAAVRNWDGMVAHYGIDEAHALAMLAYLQRDFFYAPRPDAQGYVDGASWDLTGFGPYYGDACSSLREFRRSLARLRDISAKVWVNSHHRGIYTDRDHFLSDLAAYTAKLEEREQRLLALLKESPKTLAQLVEVVRPGAAKSCGSGAETGAALRSAPHIGRYSGG